MSDVKLCKDCRWVILDPSFGKAGDDAAALKFAKCERSGQDPVTGAPKYYCTTERGFDAGFLLRLLGVTFCGRKGRYWEPRA